MPREINHKQAFGSRAFRSLARTFEYAADVQTHPDPTIDHADKVILDQAFEAAWAVIQAHDPFRDLDNDEQLRLAVRRKLFALIAIGQRDPETLRNVVLADTPLGQRQTQAA